MSVERCTISRSRPRYSSLTQPGIWPGIGRIAPSKLWTTPSSELWGFGTHRKDGAVVASQSRCSNVLVYVHETPRVVWLYIAQAYVAMRVQA